MANVKITDLPADVTPADGSVLEVAALSGSTFTSKKMSLATLADYIRGKFVTLGFPWALYRSGVPVPVTGTTVETVVATITVPGGVLGPNGFLEIPFALAFAGTASSRTTRIRLNGVELWTYPATLGGGQAVRGIVTINNAGSVSAQVGSNNPNGLGLSGGALPTASVNTAANTTLTITMQNSTTADISTLTSGLVRITYGA
jgi:hypothetical protein